MIWCGLKIKENYHVLVSQFKGNFRSKTLSFRKIKYVFRDVRWCFNASLGLKGLRVTWHRSNIHTAGWDLPVRPQWSLHARSKSHGHILCGLFFLYSGYDGKINSRRRGYDIDRSDPCVCCCSRWLIHHQIACKTQSAAYLNAENKKLHKMSSPSSSYS